MSIIKESRILILPYASVLICTRFYFCRIPLFSNLSLWWIEALAGAFWVVTCTFSNHWRQWVIFSFCSCEIWPRGPFHYSVVLLAWHALRGITDTLLCEDITMPLLITNVFSWEIWAWCFCISASCKSKSGMRCAKLWRIIM